MSWELTIIILISLISMQSFFISFYLTTFLECKIRTNLFYIICFFLVLLIKTNIRINNGIYLDFRLFIFIIIAILVYTLFEGNIYKKSFHYLFISCLFLIQNTFLSGYKHSDFISYKTVGFFAIFTVSTLVVFVFVYLLKILRVQNTVELERKEYLTLSIFPLISILLLISSVSLPFEEQLVLGLGLTVFNTTNFYLYNYLGEKNYLMQQQELHILQDNFHKEFLNHQRELQFLKHDLKNIFLNIEDYADINGYEDVKDKIQKIRKKFPLIEEKYSGNVAIDSILNNKIKLMKSQGLNYRNNFLVPVDLQLGEKELDVCVVLGNILDNAIEGINRENPNSYIDIGIFYNKNNLIFKINNTTSNNDINLSVDRIRSTKKAGRLGMGIASIRDRVSKFNGYSNFLISNGNFKVIVVIPIGNEEI